MNNLQESTTALAIDTSSSLVTVGLSHDGIITKKSSAPGQSQAGALSELVREVVLKAKLDFSDLSFVAVSLGPGSFTGLRVGLAFAKAVALARDIPMIGVDTFSQVQDSSCDLYLIRMKADHYYLTRATPDETCEQSEIEALRTSEIISLISSSEVSAIGCVGFSIDSEFKSEIEKENSACKFKEFSPQIEKLLLLAGRIYEQGQIPDWLELEPIYVQESTAEIRWRAAQSDSAKG